jgi:hypothetical protein
MHTPSASKNASLSSGGNQTSAVPARFSANAFPAFPGLIARTLALRSTAYKCSLRACSGFTSSSTAFERLSCALFNSVARRETLSADHRRVLIRTESQYRVPQGQPYLLPPITRRGKLGSTLVIASVPTEGDDFLKPFLSSTFLDLVEERQAVLDALRKRRLLTLAMEDFLAAARPPLEVALENLRNSDVMVLVIGFKAGSLLPDGSGSTYTSAEYEEFLRLGKEPLVFIKQKKGRGQRFPSWRNEERDPYKRKALDEFKARVCERWKPDYFTTPDGLALAVILALDDWEDRGRPGDRKTFASTAEYFAGKNPVGHFQILDFGTTLLGREEQIRALDDFAKDDGRRVCVLSGRGGIGKSKILYDWANSRLRETAFLKDAPFWHEDSEKEIPITCKTVIVDDAHRQETFGKVLQLLQETVAHRNLKLIVSTRPGSATLLSQQISRQIDPSQTMQLPELQELNREQSRALAKEVLGDDFRNFAEHLAEIGSNSPLVIVAGGRLIATHRIDPSTLTTLEEFRSTIFNHLLDEMDLHGPKFLIDPPFPVLHLVAALGPIDVESHDFQESAQVLLGRPIDEILATLDALASNGIITPRPRPVRVLPDVLSDYLLEERCIGPGSRSTHYADRVYELFGAHSLKSLMRNLAELDWRRGQSGETGLNLLDGIWADIHQRFRAGDEYERHRILTDLSSAAIYQPRQVIALVRAAIDNPIQTDATGEGSQYRAGQSYVLSALPSLLEATAYHPDRLRESITTLWELTKRPLDRGSGDGSAKAALKRLASWQRFGNPALNFAMLVQAIHLTSRADAFTSDFTPFTLIQQILERDGEFNEWQDERTMSIGGFGLNYAAVGLVRESALDYLDSVLEGDSTLALHAASIMQDLLHQYLNRMGRQTTEYENEWQNRERERCLQALLHRYHQPASPLLKAKLYNALRSATGINCPEPIQQAAKAALTGIVVDDAVAVVDAICTEEHELPLLSTDLTEADWERPITELMMKGRTSLERLISSAGNQARFTIDQTRACIEVRVKTGGFHRFMLVFSDRPDFLNEMADQLIAHLHFDEMVGHLSAVMDSIHIADPAGFRQRALSALESGAVHVIHASASNLRVFARATEEDIAVIQAYAGYPDPVAKRGAIFAITYMGKFTELRQNLKDAVLSIHAEGDKTVAADLADAFGPYGVPLTSLTRDEAAAVASEFLLVDDWEFDQGAIPRFLNRFVNLFPDEIYDLLLRRIEQSTEARKNNQWGFRSLGLVHQNISFGGVPAEKRLQLGRDCLARLIESDSAEDLSNLFWDVAGYEPSAFQLILETVHGVGERGVGNIATLVDKAIPRLAFTNPAFTKDLIGAFTGKQRERLVEAFAHQARHLSGGVYAGDPEDYMAERAKQFAAQVAAFPDEAGLEDLAKELRKST